MSLTSASTDAQVWAAYDDNASYEEDGSRSKALAFITACRIILRRRPSMQSRGQMSLTFESIREEMNSARAWLNANPGTSRDEARYASFENYRDH
jgi:hypothetical protein